MNKIEKRIKIAEKTSTEILRRLIDKWHNENPDLNDVLGLDLCGWGGPTGFIANQCFYIFGKETADQAESFKDEFDSFMDRYIDFIMELESKLDELEK